MPNKTVVANKTNSLQIQGYKCSQVVDPCRKLNLGQPQILSMLKNASRLKRPHSQSYPFLGHYQNERKNACQEWTILHLVLVQGLVFLRLPISHQSLNFQPCRAEEQH